MGGPGSTRWHDHTPRPLVEDCLVTLEARRLAEPDPGAIATLSWSRPWDGAVLATATFSSRVLANGHRLVSLALQPFWLTEPIEQQTRLIPQPMPMGGHRWVAKCPRCGDRRTRTLYLPVGYDHLACRVCAGLGYRSSRQSDPRISQLRRDPVALRAALTSKDVSWNWLGLVAMEKETRRVQRWLASPDPSKRFSVLCELDPALMQKQLEGEGLPSTEAEQFVRELGSRDPVRRRAAWEVTHGGEQVTDSTSPGRGGRLPGMG